MTQTSWGFEKPTCFSRFALLETACIFAAVYDFEIMSGMTTNAASSGLVRLLRHCGQMACSGSKNLQGPVKQTIA